MIEDLSDQLKALIMNLNVQWNELRTVWSDSVRRNFEQQYIEPLCKEVEGTSITVRELADAIVYARQTINDE